MLRIENLRLAYKTLESPAAVQNARRLRNAIHIASWMRWGEELMGASKIAAAALLVCLSGCALEPTAVGVTAAHDSHALQHIGHDRTNYGKDSLGIAVDWTRGPVTLSLGESYSVHGNDGSKAPREAFNATVRVDIWHK